MFTILGNPTVNRTLTILPLDNSVTLGNAASPFSNTVCYAVNILNGLSGAVLNMGLNGVSPGDIRLSTSSSLNGGSIIINSGTGPATGTATLQIATTSLFQNPAAINNKEALFVGSTASAYAFCPRTDFQGLLGMDGNYNLGVSVGFRWQAVCANHINAFDLNIYGGTTSTISGNLNINGTSTLTVNTGTFNNSVTTQTLFVKVMPVIAHPAVVYWDDIPSGGNGQIGLLVSDENQKQDIQPSDLGLEFIEKISPVKFHYINGSKDTYEYGFTAQDILKVLDELQVKETRIAEKLEDSYTVNIFHLLSPMVKAIQELSQQNKVLQARLDAI